MCILINTGRLEAALISMTIEDKLHLKENFIFWQWQMQKQEFDWSMNE